MRLGPSATNPVTDEEIIEILRNQARFKADYPENLFAATRVAFLARVEKLDMGRKFSSEPTLTTPLEHLQSAKPNLPPNLSKLKIKKTIRKED